MPIPVAAWVDDTFPDAKSLNLACYTSDGTGDNPTGIAFHAYRPILFESYGTAATLHANTSGSQSSLASSGSITASMVIYDTAGYSGQYADQPGGKGYYQFTPAINGSAGDGVTAGGWTLLAHFAAVTHKSTQTSVSADLLGTNQTPVSGTRQLPSSTLDSTAFFLDLVSAAPGITWSPAVTVADSGSASTTLIANTTDSSGNTSRFLSVWAAVSATTSGEAVFNQGGSYPFTAPAGVTSVTVTAGGSGAGGGAGNAGVSSSYGGGGGGGGETATGAVGVTGGNNYTVVVGSGGTASNPGNVSSFAGDVANVTAHGGSAGGDATTSANGSGGAGGTGAGGTHFDGGHGAAGATGKYGGGGGSSAGTSLAGTTATGPAGAPAPVGGGPGGPGGVSDITIVQSAHGFARGTNLLTVTMGTPFQQGSTVIVLLYYQGVLPASPQEPDVTLSDGTVLSQQVNADVTSAVSIQNGLYDTTTLSGGVTGGQTGVNVVCHGTNNDVKVVLAQVYEVGGLGPAAAIDVSTSHTQGPSGADNFYTSHSAVTTKAPELWVAMTGGQQTSSFSINNPAASLGWSTDPARYVNSGGYYAGTLTAHQIVTKTGTMLFNGTFSKNLEKGALAAAYYTTAVTAGGAPVIGPGGGGGGGFGSGNAGGSGADGQVTLTWTAPSGSGYGTPALPAPYAAWSDATTVGTSSMVTVNLNGPAGPGGVLNFLSNAPVFRITQEAATSLSTGTITQVPFTGLTPTVDNYTGWSSGTYTVQRDGLYLVHGLVAFAAATAGARAALVTVNGTSYFGPPMSAAQVGTSNMAKTFIAGLHAGDTVQLAGYHTRGSSLALDTGNQTRLLLVYLCEIGAPQGTWSPPDTTFRWQSGTRPTSDGGGLTGQFQAHLGNDLGFLVNRPYLTAWQNLSQVNLNGNGGVFSTVTMDSVDGLIHIGDNGDNYSGWTSGASNLYTAPVAGWHLACFEYFTSQASATTATATAALLPSTSGGVAPSTTPDYYQAQTVTTNGAIGGGAAGLGLYYLNVGETLTPQVMGAGFSGTYNTIAGTSAGGAFHSHLEIVWISE